MPQALRRLKGRGEIALWHIQPADYPVGAAVLPRHIEAAAEDPAWPQYTKDLPLGGLLIRKRMKPVEREHDVEAAVPKGQRPHIPLLKAHMGKSLAPDFARSSISGE